VKRKSSYEIDSYKKINIIFIAIIMFIFFYCLLVPLLNFGLPSSCEGMPLSYCKSRGLTRAFSQILKFNFSAALAYNPYSIKIFLFFLVELIMRLLINYKLKLNNIKLIVRLDVVCSALLFIFSFYNLVLI